MKRIIALLCLAAAVLCTLYHPVEQPEKRYQLYFAAPAEQSHGPAVVAQPWQGEEPAAPQKLLQALLDGPKQEGAASPFPRGVQILRCEMLDDPAGRLNVVLSEQYSALTDMSLTLADYCIVMTLTQLPQVDSVEIQVQGTGNAYRSHPVLQRSEVTLPEVLP